MADPNQTDAPITKAPEATPDAHAMAGANADASSKGLSEVQNQISGPAKPADASQPAAADAAKPQAGTDAAKPPTDATKPVDSNADSGTDSGFDAFTDFAVSAWDSTASGLSSLATKAGNATEMAALGLAADTSLLADWGDGLSSFSFADSAAPAPDSKVAAPAGGGDKPSVVVNKGEITADNKTLTATGDGHGDDSVTLKGSGEEISRNAQHQITDKASDHTTTFSPHEIDTQIAGMDIRQKTDSNLPTDYTDLKPGQAMQGKNGIIYRATTFNDSEGGGTAIAGTDGTLTLEGKNGDRLVLNTKTKQVDWTDADSGQGTQHMSLAEFKQKYGQSEFHGFQINGDGSVDELHDHIHMAATAPAAAAASDNGSAGASADAPGQAIMTKTNPVDNSVTTLSVNSSGISDLRDVDSHGADLSHSQINYNNPDQAYQQFDANGNVVANYNITDDTYSGDGFYFNDQGMGITDGSIFVDDSGSFSADTSIDSVTSDDSLTNSYDTAANSFGASTYSGSSVDTPNVEVLADVTSQLQDSSLDADTLQSISDMTGGKINLDDRIDRVLEKDERREARHERREDWLARADEYGQPTDHARDKNSAPHNDNSVLDFAAVDIFNAA